MKHFNGLTPAEAERLALLLEEMGEAQQAIGKILRHGYESTHPDGGPSNRENLAKEIGDVLHSVWRLLESEDIDRDDVETYQRMKDGKVAKYLHHQP